MEKGRKEALEPYNKMLLYYLDIKAGRIGAQQVLDMMQTGRLIENKDERTALDVKFQPDNFDLIVWFAVTE